MKTLKETLKYKNPELVARIQSSLNIDPALSKAIFLDLLRWLWLCAKAKKDDKQNVLSMPGFLLPIDLGWHEFVLHTRDYSEFYSDYLGGFIHHIPEPKKQAATYLAEAELLSLLSFIELNIGPKNLERWIATYPALSHNLSIGTPQ